MYLAFSVPHDFLRADKQHSRKSVFGFDSQYNYTDVCQIIIRKSDEVQIVRFSYVLAQLVNAQNWILVVC
jgi:hypothetical protein